MNCNNQLFQPLRTDTKKPALYTELYHNISYNSYESYDRKI